jgi:hypothetical protein
MSRVLLRAVVVLVGLGVVGASLPLAEATPITARFPEGVTRGFLVLRAANGTPVAYGELTQKPAGAVVSSRLLLHFKDGSVFDETLTFSQRQVFRLESYHLIQRGPSFPAADIAFDRKSGQYRARTATKPGGEEKQASGRLDLPDDLYNGMLLTVLKNVPADGSLPAVALLAFTPEPIILRVQFGREAEERARVGTEAKAVSRYRVKFEIGGVKGVIASLIGKEPPLIRYWILDGSVPAFGRFEGAMYLNGPVWRLEQAPLEWAREGGATHT